MSERTGEHGPAEPARTSPPDAPRGPPRPTAAWHCMTGAWALMAAPLSASFPPSFPLALGVLAFGGMLGLVWSVQMLRVLFDAEARGRMTLRAAAAWAVCPATGILITALVWSGWPFVLRVKLSEPALLRLVEDLGHGRRDPSSPVRAGLIFVEDTREEENCVVLSTGWGFLAEHGLAYSRNGEPPRAWAFRFRHLYGRWYTFTHDPF